MPRIDPAEIRAARSPADIADFAALARAYAAELPFELCFQNFEAELAELPGCYAEPRGVILLARVAGVPVGCGALRPLDDRVCEMKRVYLKPEARGHGLGRRIVQDLLAAAVKRGYAEMVLDTVADMSAANALYRSLGFELTAPYCHNPLAGATYYRKQL
ncbi:MAG: GNAT family N-acetyltransferase [Phycisphaerae bacterium]|nr:GNAT family N-acetyltransferase [Phycisphaerae bacterium]